MPKQKDILMCMDYEVPIDPVTGICPVCKIPHDMQSTYLWPADKPIPERRKRVLIVDDDEEVRQSLTKIFQRQKLVVYEAEDGRMGLEQWMESYPVDYLVTDYQMPKKNGVGLCMEVSALLAELNLPIKTAIVLISADPPRMPKEVADVPVLRKPVRPAELLEKLGIKD